MGPGHPGHLSALGALGALSTHRGTAALPPLPVLGALGALGAPGHSGHPGHPGHPGQGGGGVVLASNIIFATCTHRGMAALPPLPVLDALEETFLIHFFTMNLTGVDPYGGASLPLECQRLT